MKKNNRRRSKKNDRSFTDLIIKLILIIIIIILLIHNCVLINRDKNKNPSCNVDIFDIDCKDGDDCEKVPSGGGSTGLVVSDKNIVWETKNTLKIFENPVYNLDEKIAPESTNIYQFAVKNNTDQKIRYRIDFIETNNYNINMNYKLKRNDEVLVDKYSPIKDIIVEDIVLEPNQNDTYYLDWKWISSDNDTKIGTTINSDYGLKIDIKAEAVNE